MSLARSIRLPPFEPAAAIAMLLPAATAVHSGPATDGVTLGCIPLAVPYSFPEVSEDAWLGNKRARAFHRACVITVYAQSAIAFFKFVRGDLVGGTYDALQALMGVYATQPEGIRFMPTWIMISGFNGVLGLFQVLQGYHGVPVHLLPMISLGPPVLCISAAYFGWQFVRELRAIAAGLNGDGPQDTCFVQLMGAEWWPLSALSSSSRGQQHQQHYAGHGGADLRFPPFGGEGHRLGEA